MNIERVEKGIEKCRNAEEGCRATSKQIRESGEAFGINFDPTMMSRNVGDTTIVLAADLYERLADLTAGLRFVLEELSNQKMNDS